MGKKKKKNKYYDDYDEDNIYDRETALRCADKLEMFLEAVNTYIIIPDPSDGGISEKKFEKANAVIEEAIKDLREGKYQKVFNEEGYLKYKYLIDE